MERSKLINHLIQEIYGDFVPKLYWENHEPMPFVYDEIQDSLVTEEGIGMKLELATNEVNITAVNMLIDKFQQYVKEEYKSLFNIELGYDW